MQQIMHNKNDNVALRIKHISYGINEPFCSENELTFKFVNWIVPISGQFPGGLWSSITKGASLAMFEYWRILSTDIILFSALHKFQITEACWTFKLMPYVTASPAMPVEYSLGKSLQEHAVNEGVWYSFSHRGLCLSWINVHHLHYDRSTLRVIRDYILRNSVVSMLTGIYDSIW